jgi:hypothetical protein
MFPGAKCPSASVRRGEKLKGQYLIENETGRYRRAPIRKLAQGAGISPAAWDGVIFQIMKGQTNRAKLSACWV